MFLFILLLVKNLFFSEKIWRNTKIRSSFSHVIKAVEENKRRRAEEVLRLPKSNKEGIAAVVANESLFWKKLKILSIC